MSRGFSLKFEIDQDQGSRRVYRVVACGWGETIQILEDELVANVCIDEGTSTIELTCLGTWEEEAFFLPSFTELAQKGDFQSESPALNKRFWWWNYRLLWAIHRAIADPKYRERVWFYQ